MSSEPCRVEENHKFHHFISRTLHGNKWFKKRFTRQEMQQGIEVCKSCHSAAHDLIPDKKERAGSHNTELKATGPPLDRGGRSMEAKEAATGEVRMKNLLSDIPTPLPEEVQQTLLDTGSVRVERIISRGHASPDNFWYDQEQHEWVVLLRGAARLQFEGGETALEMSPGDSVNIPAHRRHRVEWTTPDEPTVWLAVHYG